jgi:two-component system sensor histidine kinase HydH
MRSRDELMLSGIWHDLNNVFQTLAGVAAHLERDPELAAVILRSVERGRNLVAGLLDAGARAPLEAIVDRAAAFLEDFRAATRAPAIRVEKDLEPGIVLTGDRAWERVLVNLFLNSLRAMPQGGTILVQARRTNKGVKLRVADDGAGIPAELLENLFQPHVSGNGSSGLGLSIVERIVHANGGVIEAHNREPGAEFIIRLPARARAARA